MPYCFWRSSVKFQGQFLSKLGVSRLKNRQFESSLSKITRPVAAIKSLRFALLLNEETWTDQYAFFALGYSVWLPLGFSVIESDILVDLLPWCAAHEMCTSIIMCSQLWNGGCQDGMIRGGSSGSCHWATQHNCVWNVIMFIILSVLCKVCFYLFLAATKQLHKWYFPSVCLSVRLSVCLSVRPSHLFDYVPIIVSSWNFQELLPVTEVTSMLEVKVRGQRSRSQKSQPNFTVSGL